MTARHKICLLLFLTVILPDVQCNDEVIKEDLAESESKDPTKVEIIKQIKRVNEDGSYTFGYEAEDGTFKIESRDVLGNVKGTFGFVDSDGEIKRVSYSSTSNNETTTVTTEEKEKSSVIQHIPRTNRTTSTRKPIIYSSTTPSTTSVVQSIPRRRVLASSNTTTTTTTPKPSYKNIVKATDFEITTMKTSTAETPRVQQAKPAGHYIRSTFSPLSDAQRYIEGQLIRPTQPVSVTTHPTELYTRRFIATRNPYLEEHLPTIKPYTEEGITESTRGNLLRRQLNQEKVFETREVSEGKVNDRQQILNVQQTDRSGKIINYDNRQQLLQLQPATIGNVDFDNRHQLVNVEQIPEGTKIVNFSGKHRRLPDNSQVVNFDAREHMLHLQQSIGEDSTDVYSASLTTGTPRPLFTTTERPFPYAVSVNPTARLVTPIKYPTFQKSIKGNVQETTTDSSALENNYAQPNSLPIIQVANGETPAIPVVRTRHPFHGGTILIPINQAPVGSFVIEENNEDIPQQNFPQFTTTSEQQYLRESPLSRPQHMQPKIIPVPYIIPKRRPIPLEYQPIQMNHRYLPKNYPVPLPIDPMKFQDEIDNIKPPVSTRDFQKLLNRLILRQSQLQEISRLEHIKMFQKTNNQEAYGSIHPTPISVFVRTRPDVKQNNGPVQFVEQSTNSRNSPFITIPQPQTVTVQKLIDSQPDYESSYPYTPENYTPVRRYRSGRRAARILPSSSKQNVNENESYLPPDVREMLLLRMLQLAINPNLPLPPSEGEDMSTAIRQSKKEVVRNVQILGEEPEEENKPIARNKRFRESNEYEY